MPINLFLKYRDVAINFCPVSLSYAFGNPDNVSDLLFLETNISVEHAKLELLHEGLLHEVDLFEK